jgi:phosphatidylserine/phosphatidylglycerophosphate/cardiolipin synthase-like enzyme
MKKDWNKVFPNATMNEVAYLADGIPTFESYVKAIETANAPGHYIYILGWMLNIDFPFTGTPNPLKRTAPFGLNKKQHYFIGNKNLLNLLTIAASKGVEIRILVWDNPLYTDLLAHAYEELSKLPNTRIYADIYTFTTDKAKKLIGDIEGPIRELFRRITPFFISNKDLIEDATGIKPEDMLYKALYYLDTKNVGSHHEKILIVKGEQGLICHCGGLDINPNRITGQHDAACRVVGPEANRLVARFVLRWNNHPYAKADPLTGVNDVKPVPIGLTNQKLLHARVVHTFNSYDGKKRDRSLVQSYMKIIENTRNYIYIEDQYLINIDVAKALNKKLKEPLFKKLVIVIQESKHSNDLLIPDRKRGAFVDAVLKDTNAEEKARFTFLMINNKKAVEARRHNVIHAKILIADDELALIGSCNVSKRSLTLDSETSIIIFNKKEDPYRENFAYKFRQTIWRDLIFNSPQMSDFSWEDFARNVLADERYSILSTYANNMQDLDLSLIDLFASQTVQLGTSIAINEIYKDDLGKLLAANSVVGNPVIIKWLIDALWESVVDPEVI